MANRRKILFSERITTMEPEMSLTDEDKEWISKRLAMITALGVQATDQRNEVGPDGLSFAGPTAKEEARHRQQHCEVTAQAVNCLPTVSDDRFRVLNVHKTVKALSRSH